MTNVRTKVLEAVVLIALAVIAQIIVGILGQVSFVAGNQICNGNFASSGTANQGCVNYNTAGQSVTTVLNFLTIIFLVGALVILLSLFGMENVLNLRSGRLD